MTLQNRVRPDGEIVSASWRGTMMGNRGGRIHDPETRTLTTRKWSSRRWIICVTEFKNRRRKVMGESYTELFFLDEVAALACGHRPCFECRRSSANRFAELWQQAVGKLSGSRADEMDLILHSERLAPAIPVLDEELDCLPDGVFIQSRGEFFARKDGCFLKWSGTGYRRVPVVPGEKLLLTPFSIRKVLEAGYEPKWHPNIA